MPITHHSRVSVRTLEDVSVVVLSHNRKDVLQRHLDKWRDASQRYGLELVVVDNASRDGSASLLQGVRAQNPPVKLVLNTANLGVGGGRNTGFHQATRPLVLCIDEDAFIEADALSRLIAYFDILPDAGILSPRILHAETHAIQNDNGQDVCEVANFHGACHLILREVFEKVGMLDERCEFGGEELDFSIRLHAAGYRVYYIPDVQAAHDNVLRPGTVGRWRRLQWVYNFTRVNCKHFPAPMALRNTMRYSLSHLASGLRHEGPGLALSVLVSTVNGMRDGFSEKVQVPSDTAAYYNSPTLTPDFGNIPLSVKLRRRLVPRNKRQSARAT